MPDTPAPAYHEPLNSGQIVEWLVWAALVQHSTLPAHVFLPLSDRGVDGILRRPADDAMVAIQVKGSVFSPHQGPYLHIHVHDWALQDPTVRWVFALHYREGPSLDPHVLCTDTATILRLGAPEEHNGHRTLRIDTTVPDHPDSPWAGSFIQLADLADHLLPPLTAELRATVLPPPVVKDHHEKVFIGSLAEVEVMRLLSEIPELNVFKSFPDMELTEYIVRQTPSGRMRGIQVKCTELDGPESTGTFHVRGRDLMAPTTALVAVLGWRHDLGAFDDQALLFPAAKVQELCHHEGPNWGGGFSPRPKGPTRWDPYRIARSDLGHAVLRSLAP